MSTTLAPVTALLVGLAFLLLGGGLQGTLLGVRAGLEAFRVVEIGVMMSAYYVGWVAGSLRAPRLVGRVGHIRTFAALSAIASIAALGHGFLVHPWGWTVFRFATGFCIAGLFIVVESWLNDRATNQTRGTLLAVYMIVSLLAMAGGQQLLLLADPRGVELFALTAALVSAALIPVALTTSVAPTPIRTARLGLRRLYAISPLGIAGCFANGLIVGSFWGLGPVFGVGIGLDTGGIAMFMTATILGGAALQWPIGALSDRFDRRTVITVVCFVIMLAAGGVAVLAAPDSIAMFAFAALFGGVSFPLYALCNAHTNDHIDAEHLVEAGSGLLLAYGIGASLGPLLAAQTMQLVGAHGLYVFGAAIAAVVGLFALWRMTRRPAIPAEAQGPYVAVTQTTAVALELDPRGPGEEDVAAEQAAPTG